MRCARYLFWIHAVLALALTSTYSQNNDLNIIEIRQVINLFAILVDTYQYTQLERVFTTNATVNFNRGSILYGLPAIINALEPLASVTSHHDLTTQYIDVISSTRANATTYLIGNFFGKGDLSGQIFSEYGQSVGDASAGEMFADNL